MLGLIVNNNKNKRIHSQHCLLYKIALIEFDVNIGVFGAR